MQLFMRMNRRIISIVIILSLVSAQSNGHVIQIKNTQQHNRRCYSQGLFFFNATHLFQTCGLYNQSFFQLLQYRADPFQIKPTYQSNIPWKSNVFLQGAILFKQNIYLLTWRQNIVYKLNPNNFQIVQEIKWRKQGWGLTHNGTHMFTTDGSNNIFLVDSNFKLIESKQIQNKLGRKLYNINQLQYVDGFIYANIYLDTKIVKIDYGRGKVVEQYDSANLIKAQKSTNLKHDEVINGIAYDQQSKQFILTGKRWSKFYLVDL